MKAGNYRCGGGGAVMSKFVWGYLLAIQIPLMGLAHPVDIYDFPIYYEEESAAIEVVENEAIIKQEQPEDLEKNKEIEPELLEITESEQPSESEVIELIESEPFAEPENINVSEELPDPVIDLPHEKESDPQSRPNRFKVATRYLLFGFEHILPKGLDHILFVLALFLLSIKFSYLVWQITAFTIAHSITLGLSIYGYLSLSSDIVEPLIALSIVFVAIENLFTVRLKPWRPFIVFIFGLLHGLGFAGVLAELGLPRRDFLTALLTFNLGVEGGQLTVIALAYLVLGWFIKKRWYRKSVIVPASLLIALTGAYWTIERLFL